MVRVSAPTEAAPDFHSGISPSGHSLFFSTGDYNGAPPPVTRLVSVAAGRNIRITGHIGCLWIDDISLSAPDAIIADPSVAVTALPPGASCAGRFPGGLWN